MRIENLTNRIRIRNGHLTGSCWCLLRMASGEDPGAFPAMLQYGENRTTPLHFSFRKCLSIRGKHVQHYRFSIPCEELAALDIQNRLSCGTPDDSFRLIRFCSKDKKTGKYKSSNLCFWQGHSVYLRQSEENNLYLTIRSSNDFDSLKGRIKILAGLLAAKIRRLSRQSYILMYEKECQKYEESASVLFEKLMQEGYKHIYFILDAKHPAYSRLSSAFPGQILKKHSIRHIARFFGAHDFISTETISHSLQLRTANRHIIRKYHDKDIRFVFLQHGVSYMVSLDAQARNGFRPEGLAMYRVTVSSELEAKHFTELAGLQQEEVYITGMAKFDRCTKDPDADKIVIMPTWRRWEVNQASRDFTATGYYRMIKRIIEAVPAHLQPHIVLLPHPLMQEAIQDNPGILSRYLVQNQTHDALLRTCRVLITDYSSIAYDAFYRGANVIFYWEDKEECMKHYGGGHLMLNENNTFGDICYNPMDLSKCMESNYTDAQSDAYLERFCRIVSFHDGKNSERIISELRKDQIIS